MPLYRRLAALLLQRRRCERRHGDVRAHNGAVPVLAEWDLRHNNNTAAAENAAAGCAVSLRFASQLTPIQTSLQTSLIGGSEEKSSEEKITYLGDLATPLLSKAMPGLKDSDILYWRANPPAVKQCL